MMVSVTVVAFFLSKVHLCVGILRELEEARRNYQYSIGIFHAGVTSPFLFSDPPHLTKMHGLGQGDIYGLRFFKNCH